jgi:quercetin dioxygenase-like cupin family protein
LIFALFEYPDGVETEPGPRVVYDLERESAHLGAARVAGPALVWEVRPETDLVTDRHKVGGALAAEPVQEGADRQIAEGGDRRIAERHLVTDRHKEGSALAVEVALDPGSDWLVRCDRIDFPAGGVAYRHDHPGPGIRRLLFGELTIESDEGTHTYGAGDTWFEDAGYPVLARAAESEPTAFVRVLLLPPEWAGRRTIRYLDPADEERPKLQRATILLEEPLEP